MKTKLEIRTVKIKDINPAAYNPRIMSEKELKKLNNIMQDVGMVSPLVWNEQTGNLVDGHQRYKVLMKEGVQEVDVSVVNLPLEKEKVLNLALNRIKGDWDEAKLAVMLQELTALPDFNVGLTGFELPEIGQIIDKQKKIENADNFNTAEFAEAIEEPITKPGDIIHLWDHKIICGDASDINVLKKLFGDDKAGLVHTDFPYNVDYTSKGTRKWDKIINDNLPQGEYEQWMRGILVNIKQFITPGTSIYLWQGHRQFPPMYQILLDLGFHISCVICWAKESAALSFAPYSFKTEQAIFGWSNGASHYWAGDRGENNLWEVKRESGTCHPTQKPVLLPGRAIKNSSRMQDIVLDVFLGSGSTLMAAEGLGRRCYGVELSPKYCDAIVNRYVDYMGVEKSPKEIVEKYIGVKPTGNLPGTIVIKGDSNE